MATLRSNVTSTHCTLVLVDPFCGETVRAALKAGGLQAKNLRPSTAHMPLRRRLPVFPVNATGRPLVPEPCSLLLEVVEAACEERERVEPPASYVLVGPVAIVSYDERVRGREREVAEKLLAVPGVRAVYAKVSTEGEFRAQKLVHLAGEKFEFVTYKEHGIVVRLPLGKVYVNPRLAAEHDRLARMVGEGERVLDMFAGWGGFSLAISRLGRARLIVANDFNPYAIETLVDAVRRNKGKLRTPIIPVMADARMLPEILAPVFTRIIMNLPHNAVDYIPVAVKLCNPSSSCVLHVYTIASTDEEAVERVKAYGTVSGASRVLDYAPRKYIYRVDLVVKHRREE